MHFRATRILLLLCLTIFFAVWIACENSDDPPDSREAIVDSESDDDSIFTDDDSPGDDDDSYPDDGTSWTFVVYLAADNDLESYAQADLAEMVGVGSTSRVNIVVIYDGTAFEDSRYYHVEKGELAVEKEPGELNMGAPETLVDSATWAFETYPADKTALVLWDHGSGWHKNGKPRILRSICQDDGSDNDWIELDELHFALSEIRENTGIEAIGLLGFDACLMQMIEVAYSVKDEAEVLVGSEEVEAITGWAYDRFLGTLVNNPGMTPAQLGERITKTFAQTPDATLSMVRLPAIRELADTVSDFAQELIAAGGRNLPTVVDALWGTLYFDDYDYIDLYHFAENIIDEQISQEVSATAQAVIDALEQTVIASDTGLAGYNDAHGLSIYFPDKDYSVYDQDYANLPFSADTVWDEFIAW